MQCFDLDGEFVKTVKPAEFGSRIFSTAYTKAKGIVFSQLREGCGKSKWKFKMAFAMKGGGLEGVSSATYLF